MFWLRTVQPKPVQLQPAATATTSAAVSLKPRRGRDSLLRSELRAMQVLEVARAADAQATMLRRNSNQCARLLLSEAEDRVKILPKEGQGSCRVIWGAGWAKRERDMSVWETRCQVVLLGVYRESRGTGQVGGGHSAVVLLLHYPCTWKQGRVRYRAQEEAAKLWAKEGVQSLGIVRWHVRVLEQAARRDLCTRVRGTSPSHQPDHGKPF